MSTSTSSPVIQMARKAPSDQGGYNVTIAFDVDLRHEFDEYVAYSKTQPREAQRPFLDEISFVAQQIMNGFVDQSSIDAQGWGIQIRKGRVIVNDVRHVAHADAYKPTETEEPF